MKVAILGYGVEGKSAEKYWRGLGAEVEIRNDSTVDGLPDGVTDRTGDDYLADLAGFDVIVRSPILRPDTIAAANPGVDLTPKLTSVTREFIARCPAHIIGVTGTKGKGTTVTLTAKILDAAGYRVHVGGNIGVAPLDFLAEVKPEDIVVLELSSFQLIDFTQSPQTGVCLMVVPEHLNWHADFEEYANAKGNIFRYQKPGDRAVYYPDNETSTRLSVLSAGERIPYYRTPGAVVEGDEIKIDGQIICRTTEVALPGPHNLQNICAAITATWELIDHKTAPITQVVKSFAGLPHHLEMVGEVTGVKYYDDSFSTTPETAVAALKSFDADKVAILGGSDKGIGFAELARAVEEERVIHALLIGDTAPTIAAELDKFGFSHYTVVKWGGMEALVQTASHLVEPGDIVLLSPGCASFGIFSNYKDRGQQFQAAVNGLKEGK